MTTRAVTRPRTPAETEALLRRVGEIDWWHTIDLGDGVVTPGRGGSDWRLEHMQMPEDLHGASVLDIGTWDGLFAFEAKRRGAARVVALDDWQHPGFPVARDALDLDVEFVAMDARDMDAAELGTFDLVLFMGVLYHVPDPIRLLRRVRDVTAGQLILETDTALNDVDRPAMELRARGDSYGDTAQNWFVPNTEALLRMLDSVGFARREIVAAPSGRPGLVGRMLGRRRDGRRTIVHAWV